MTNLYEKLKRIIELDTNEFIEKTYSLVRLLPNGRLLLQLSNKNTDNKMDVIRILLNDSLPHLVQNDCVDGQALTQLPEVIELLSMSQEEVDTMIPKLLKD